ncbi:MAG: methylated-DNA--[protein]-cysteine S-methyltransferase [Hyphomicrobiales bacterium]
MSAPAAHHQLFDTVMGECGVAWNGRGLCGIQLPEIDRGQTELRLAVKCRSTNAEDAPPWVQSVVADVQRYMAGRPIDFSAITVDLEGIDDFRQKLYAALREVPFGQTVTYGELAARLGMTGWEGARDVGEAMGRNPVPVVIPCHRVLAAGKKPGGFSAYGGVATKQKLLALEGVSLDMLPQRAPIPPRLPGL